MSKKHTFLISVPIVLLLITCVISKKWPDRYLHFITCDVGQGDALLITLGFTQILIDAGKDTEVLHCLDEYIPFWDRDIELIVITHPDFDHYGGMKGVLERYTVKKLAQLPFKKNDAEFEALQTIVQAKKEKGMAVFSPVAHDYLFRNQDLEIKTLWPQKKLLKTNSTQTAETLLSDITIEQTPETLDTNILSITLLLEYKNSSFLLTGDLEKEAELAVARNNMTMDIDVLKVGHHGSKHGTQAEFLRIARPEIAVVSAGKNNQYNHPDKDVTLRLEQYVKTSLYRTDLEGTIHLYTDGFMIWKK